MFIAQYYNHYQDCGYVISSDLNPKWSEVCSISEEVGLDIFKSTDISENHSYIHISEMPSL